MANKSISFAKNYLTNDELSYIVSEVVKHDDAVLREIVKVGMVAQLVIKDLGEFEDCNGVYDYVVKNNIDLNEVVNYKTLDKLIESEIGINKIIKDFVKDITAKIEKSIGDFNLNDFVSQLEDLSKKTSGVVNTENESKVTKSSRKK